MTALDRMLQRWRIRMARPYLVSGKAILDIGSSDGALYHLVPGIGPYVGIDPLVKVETRGANYSLIRGFFPAQIQDGQSFDAITMLAVLEHIPADAQHELAANCYRYLNPGGYVVITVPSERVDAILALLRWLRLVHGMSLEEHYGFQPEQTPMLFESKGFVLVKRKSFQLGLNNLFVFQKPARQASTFAALP